MSITSNKLSVSQKPSSNSTALKLDENVPKISEEKLGNSKNAEAELDQIIVDDPVLITADENAEIETEIDELVNDSDEILELPSAAQNDNINIKTAVILKQLEEKLVDKFEKNKATRAEPSPDKNLPPNLDVEKIASDQQLQAQELIADVGSSHESVDKLFVNDEIVDEVVVEEEVIESTPSLDSVLTRLTPTCSEEFKLQPFCAYKLQESYSDFFELDNCIFEQNIFPELENVFLNYFNQDPPPPLSAFEKYQETCYKFNRIPIKALERIFEDEDSPVLDLEGYTLDAGHMKVICAQILGPPIIPIQQTNLSNCELNIAALTCLSQFIGETDSLMSLNLSYCVFNDESVEVLAEGLFITQSISELIMHHCDIRDTGGAILLKSIVYNDALKVIDLSFNKLGSLSGIQTAEVLKNNEHLLELNLKWNFINAGEAIGPLIRGLSKNVALKKLNLSWNGISDVEFSNGFSMAMRRNTSLEELNLENNRLSVDNSEYIGLAIRKSRGLLRIFLGANPWTRECYTKIIKKLVPASSCKFVSLGEHTWLTKEENEIIEKQIEKSSDLQVIFKGVMLNNPPEPVNFKNVLFDRSKFLGVKPKRAKQKREFGHFAQSFAELEDPYVDRDQFKEMVEKYKIKLNDELVAHLMDEFEITYQKRSVIDLPSMASEFLERHPIEPLPPKVVKKERKKKKGKGKSAKKAK